MAKILIIEDDAFVAAELRNWLMKEKFTADICTTGDDGLYRLKHYEYDLAIVDWNLPGMTGIDICQSIRKEKNDLPLLMLTSRKDLSDRIEGLDAGALDYMVKPCALLELSARIRALLRRHSENRVSTRVASFDLSMDAETRESFCGEQTIKLSPTEFSLLHALVKCNGNPLDPKSLGELLNMPTDDAFRSKLKNYMSVLRKKLLQHNSVCTIEYKSLEGYCLAEKNQPAMNEEDI